MPGRTPPKRVVVSLCVYENGASHAVHELVADISLQLCAVSLTENLWAWQAHKEDKSAGKLCSMVRTGRSRRGNKNAVQNSLWLMACFANFMKKHCLKMCPGRKISLMIMPFEDLALVELSLKRLAIQQCLATWQQHLPQKGKQKTRRIGRESCPN